MTNTPKWLFIVFLLWLFATMWSNALEPAKTSLLSNSVAATSGEASISAIEGLKDPGIVSQTGLAKVWDWVGNIWKALSFDYVWFDGWTIGAILRAICIFFSIVSLYCIADIIWKVRSIILGQ